jgi:hypothetical protein
MLFMLLWRDFRNWRQWRHPGNLHNLLFSQKILHYNFYFYFCFRDFFANYIFPGFDMFLYPNQNIVSKADKDAQKNVDVSFKYSWCVLIVLFMLLWRNFQNWRHKMTSVTLSGKFAQLAFFPENFTLQF